MFKDLGIWNFLREKKRITILNLTHLFLFMVLNDYLND